MRLRLFERDILCGGTACAERVAQRLHLTSHLL
jgi:hypothetical protein